MKWKNAITLAIVLFCLFSCRNITQLDSYSGNYIIIALDLPESELGSSRSIHPDSTDMTVSLTYQEEEEPVYSDTVSLDSLSDGFFVMEDLTIGSGVTLCIELSADGLVLSSASTVLDINRGGNSAEIALEYNSYTILGALVDTSGNPLKSQSIIIGDTTYTSGADGSFSFTLSTEDWDDYLTLQVPVVVDSEVYNFARTKKQLIESRNDFELAVQGEVFVDLTIQSELFPIEGATLYISYGDYYTTLTSDANGQISYTEEDETNLATIAAAGGSSEVAIYTENGMFIEQMPLSNDSTIGTPGALVGDIVLDPYVFVLSGYYSAPYIFTVDFDTSSTVSNPLYSILYNAGLSEFALTTDSDGYGGKLFVDYENGYFYFFFINYSTYTPYLARLTSLSASSLDYLALSSVFTDFNSDDKFSVQQMSLIEDGDKLLVITTKGAITVDTSTMSISDTWDLYDSSTSSITILNGGFEADDGTLYVMGGDYDSSGPVDGAQKIFSLGSSGLTSVSSLPSSYSGFSDFYNYASSYSTFQCLGFDSMLGLFPWGDNIMSVKTQDSQGSVSGGTVLSLTNSWGLDDSVDNSYNYLVPIGILPDNRFYIVNESVDDYGTKDLLRMDSPSDSTPDSAEFLSSTYYGYQTMLYYFNPSGM